MDDTQQTAQPTGSTQPGSTMPTMGDLAGMPTPPAPAMPTGMVPGGDLTAAPMAGMTPPPAPEPSVQIPTPSPMPAEPVAPVMPTEPAVAPMPSPAEPPAMPTNPTPEPAANRESTMHAENADDYSYAEDILSEILDSLDRIEAKLEAMEKKQG